MKQDYYYNLDFLKIVFTLIVVLYHFIRKMDFWCEGGYAVELFFIISGFLCAKTFDNNLSILDFAKKRISSFMPFLLIAIILFIPYEPFSINKILNNIFLTPVWHYDLFISVAWYINVWFCLSLALFCLAKTFKKEHIFFIIGICVFYSVSLMISYNKWLTWEKINFMNAGFFRGIASMGMGYLLAQLPPPPANLYCDCKIKKTSSKNIFYTLLECFVLIYTVGCMFIKSWYISPFIIFISSITLIYLFIQKKGLLSHFTNHPNFLRIGKFTLPVYLLQQTPIALFSIYLSLHKEQIIQYPYLTIIITLAGVCLWGICGYYFVKRVSNYMHKYFNL